MSKPVSGGSGVPAAIRSARSRRGRRSHQSFTHLPLYRFNFGEHPPVQTVRPGAVVEIEFPDSDGLLYLGDMHAAQGQGEMVGGGLEVSGKVRVRVGLEKRVRLRWPRYRTREGRGCIVVQPNLEKGVQHSMAEMIQWLTEDGWNRADAYLTLSQTCAFRFGGIGARYAVVACFTAHAHKSRPNV